MVRELLAAAIPVGVMIVGACAVPLVLYAWHRARSAARMSPLTRDLLRPPGHSLRVRIEELDGSIAGYLAFLPLMPLLAYAMHVSQSYFAGQPEGPVRIVASACIGLGAVLFFARLLWNALHEWRRLRLGLDGELAVGEELNQLMLAGCHVFHDIPYPYGNIDHVVVSPTGVYSVNTKMRGKPKRAESRAEALVDGDRNAIQFPDGEYTIPTAQLEAESRWLEAFLSDATGEALSAQPMLAFPGWYITRRGRKQPVYVFNPRNPQQLFLAGRTILTPEQIQRIAHQLDRLCRDVQARPPSPAGWPQPPPRTKPTG